jgi:hypothetical protein
MADRIKVETHGDVTVVTLAPSDKPRKVVIAEAAGTVKQPPSNARPAWDDWKEIASGRHD